MANIAQKIIEFRRHIHQYPELSNQEFKTTDYIGKVLHSLKISSKRITKTGITGTLHSGTGNKCIALRADIDALPVHEKSAIPKQYQSKNKGIMHACGHDANTAIVLGAALLLSQQKGKLNGAVKFIFQPNEETSGGAKQLVSAGVLNNPKVNIITGIHVTPELESGVIGLKYGELLAAVDKFEIELYGGGGHSAYPHRGKDTIYVASQVIQSLQAVVSRELNPVEPVVISIGQINGGTAFNILADKVVMIGTVRTLNENIRKQVQQLMKKHIANIAKTYNLQFRFKYSYEGYPVYNNKSVIDLCYTAAKKITRIVMLDKPTMGGEDFSEYLRHVPGCFIYLGIRKKGMPVYPWHHPEFVVDESALHTGSEVLAELVTGYLTA